MAPRANWKGYLKVGELTCPVALFTAASTAERVAFHTLNRETGHRVHRQFIDEETGKPVPHDEQVKGYEVAPGDYVMLEPDEVAAAIPDSDKALAIDAFIGCNTIDDTYFDRPYYLAPTNQAAEEAFGLLRDGMSSQKVAALAQAVLFRRVRTLLIRPHGRGLVAWTLNFDYEVRPAQEAFGDIAEMKIKGEMLDLAKHIIKTKAGTFDPSQFDDRYEAAVAELVRAKLEGKPIKARKPQREAKVVDLMEALRHSAGLKAPAKASATKAAAEKTPAKKTAPKKVAAKAQAKAGSAKGGKATASKRKATAVQPARRRKAS